MQYYSSVSDEKKRCNIDKACPWVIPGVNRSGIYPVFPWKRSWHLDQHGGVPRLEVKRFQIQDSLICSGCKNVRRFTSFAKSERSKADGIWLCLTCMTKKCSNCRKFKPKKIRSPNGIHVLHACSVRSVRPWWRPLVAGALVAQWHNRCTVTL